MRASTLFAAANLLVGIPGERQGTWALTHAGSWLQLQSCILNQSLGHILHCTGTWLVSAGYIICNVRAVGEPHCWQFCLVCPCTHVVKIQIQLPEEHSEVQMAASGWELSVAISIGTAVTIAWVHSLRMHVCIRSIKQRQFTNTLGLSHSHIFVWSNHSQTSHKRRQHTCEHACVFRSRHSLLVHVATCRSCTTHHTSRKR